MEFKDKLKALRKQRGISQKTLAEAIFVSRSAVAKWENGLGLPADDSMTALLEYFQISADYFSTQEPEKVIVQKNRHIRQQTIMLIALVLVICLAAAWIHAHTDAGMTLTVYLLQTPLENHARAQLANGTYREYFWGYHIYTFPDAGAVFYEYYPRGYSGFFYSASGEPVGYQGTDMDFYRYGSNHYYYQEETGDNRMHIIHITGNWYWYEMHF